MGEGASMRSRRGALIVRIVVVLTAAMAWPAVRASADPVPVGVFLEAQPLFAHVRQDLTLSFPDFNVGPHERRAHPGRVLRDVRRRRPPGLPGQHRRSGEQRYVRAPEAHVIPEAERRPPRTSRAASQALDGLTIRLPHLDSDTATGTPSGDMSRTCSRCLSAVYDTRSTS